MFFWFIVSALGLWQVPCLLWASSAHGRQSPAFLWELFLQAGDAAMQSEMELKIAWLK